MNTEFICCSCRDYKPFVRELNLYMASVTSDIVLQYMMEHKACDKCRLTGKTHPSQKCQSGYLNWFKETVWCDVHDVKYVYFNKSDDDLEDEVCICCVCVNAHKIRINVEETLVEFPDVLVDLVVEYGSGMGIR
jgi:hypothetical protein